MKFILLLPVLIFLMATSISAQTKQPETIPGRVIVKLTDEAYRKGTKLETLGDAADFYRATSITPWLPPRLVTYNLPYRKSMTQSGSYGLLRIMVVEYSADAPPEEVAAAFASLPGVEYAEPVYRRRLFFTPNDPQIGLQWHLEKIGAYEAWDAVRADSTMLIAIVDAGVDPNQEDLNSMIWQNAGELGLDNDGLDKKANNKDDDGNGLVDDWRGYDFAGSTGFNPDNAPDPAGEAHGTEVAAIAAAIGQNEKGIAGVAYGARVLAIKIAADGPYPDLPAGDAGILYAAKMGAKIINCSWGGYGKSRASQEVIDEVTGMYNALVIGAAGNDGIEEMVYPASYRGVFSVAATSSFDARWSNSNYNYRVDLSAPGQDIFTAITSTSYGYRSGTSESAPMVSASAALLRKKYPTLSAEQIFEVLRATSDDISGSLGGAIAPKMGAGRLNLAQAVATGPATTSARVVEHSIVDANSDGALDPGETVTLRLTVRNILADASAVNVQVAPATAGEVTIENESMSLGAMTSGETRTSASDRFRFVIPSNAAADSKLVLRVSVSSPDRTNVQYITLDINPTILTTDLNKIALTFTSDGEIAFNDVHDRGEGFSFDNSKNYLYHGGLMIGIDSARLVDQVRVARSSDGTADGFRMKQPYRLSTSGDSTRQRGVARFDDSHREAFRRVGVDVRMETTEYHGMGADNILFITYRIVNMSGETLNNLHTALYLDWDLGYNGQLDQINYDPSQRMGVVNNTASSTTPYIGTMLLSDQSVDFYAINNNDPNIEPTSNFTPERKWMVMSSGVANQSSGIQDVSMTIGGGRASLEAGGTEIVAFAIVASRAYDSLLMAAVRARELYPNLNGVTTSNRPVATGSAVVQPHPLSTSGAIIFEAPTASHATLVLYDATGRAVMTPFAGHLEPGRHAIGIDVSDLADGLYLYTITMGDRVLRGKLVKGGDR